MSNEKIQYVSAQGLVDLQKELKELKDNKIPEIAELIDEAKQQGDLSENAEYDMAKEQMAWAQGRVNELRYLIDHAVVVSSQQNEGVVKIGSTITIKTATTTKSYTIVGQQEANPLEGKISNESPLGESFFGHKVGDKVEVTTPAGKQAYEIIDVK